jgi:hypothetical protein
MEESSYKIENITNKQLQNLSKKENAVVMKPEYDYHDPWENKELKECVMKCIGMNGYTEEDIDLILSKDRLLKRFKTNHPTLFKTCVSNPKMKEDKHRQVIMFMLDQKKMVDRGSCSYDTASQKVSAVSMAVNVKDGKVEDVIEEVNNL